MKNGVIIEQMLGMTVGQIQDLKKSQMLIQNVIDQQVSSIKDVIENNKVKEQTAQEILSQCN